MTDAITPMSIVKRIDWKMASQWLVGTWLIGFALGASSVIIGARRDSVEDISTLIYAVAMLAAMPASVIFGAAGLVSYSFGARKPRSRDASERSAALKVKVAWIVATIAGALSLYAATHSTGPRTSYLLIDAAVVLTLAWLVRGRAAAAGFLLFAYYVASRVGIVATTAAEGWIPPLIVFGFIFWRGALGLLRSGSPPDDTPDEQPAT